MDSRIYQLAKTCKLGAVIQRMGRKVVALRLLRIQHTVPERRTYASHGIQLMVADQFMPLPGKIAFILRCNRQAVGISHAVAEENRR